MKQWYVINTKPHQEEKALINLARQGYDAWLPRFTKSVCHARKVVKKKEALFPGYLFVFFDIENTYWTRIRHTYGVKSIIGNTKPASIDSEFIKKLQENLKEGSFIASSEYQEGDEIKIVLGPFANTIATIKKLLPKQRVEILLDLLGGNVTTQMQRSSIVLMR